METAWCASRLNELDSLLPMQADDGAGLVQARQRLAEGLGGIGGPRSTEL